MANKTFNTRVKNKRDTAANWEAVATTFQPLDGELIIVDTAAGKTRFKVGRYDTAKGRLLYYNEIPFTDEYLYNDLNESQGKIYDKLKGIDDKSIIEMTLEPSNGNSKVCVYHIGLWQFPKTGLYKIHLTQHGTTSDLFKVFARKTKDDGTLLEDFNQDNLVILQLAMGDAQVNDLYIQVDYTDNDKLTVYNVRFLTLLQPYNAQVNVYDKTTQKWQFVSATYVQSAKYADRLAHQLTLTKGDTTTKFDGYTAQTVSIPTKTSELTNDSNFTTQTDLDNLTNTVVSYNAQENITDEQKAQARTNIGAISEADLVQPDWNQNDTTAKDYIKNRICYEGETVTELGNTAEVWVSLVGEEASTSVLKLLDIPISYKIKGILYENQKPSKMEDYVMYYGERYGENPEYVMISTYSPHNISFNGMEASDFQFVKIENTVKQIDPKFIPTVSPDWNQNDETAKDYIKNRTHYITSSNTEIVSEQNVTATSFTRDDKTYYKKEFTVTNLLSLTSNQKCEKLSITVDNQNYNLSLIAENFANNDLNLRSKLFGNPSISDFDDIADRYFYFYSELNNGEYACAILDSNNKLTLYTTIQDYKAEIKLYINTYKELDKNYLPSKITIIDKNTMTQSSHELFVQNLTNESATYEDVIPVVSFEDWLSIPKEYIPLYNSIQTLIVDFEATSANLELPSTGGTITGSIIMNDNYYIAFEKSFNYFAPILYISNIQNKFSSGNTNTIPSLLNLYFSSHDRNYDSSTKLTHHYFSAITRNHADGQLYLTTLDIVNNKTGTITVKNITSPTTDTALSSTSENPVQNKVVKAAIDNKTEDFKIVATLNNSNNITLDKTYDEIKAAVEADKNVYIWQTNNNKYCYIASINNNIVFGSELISSTNTYDSITGIYIIVNNTSVRVSEILVPSLQYIDNQIEGIPLPDAELSTTSENPVQNKVITTEIQTINNKLGGLTGAMHFIGKAAVDITDGSTTDPQIANYTTKEKGDVILGKDDHKEFVWNGAIWEELGDEGSYALKTTTINGKALSDNITLTASDVGAASASTIETMQAAIDSKPSAADAVYTATAESTDGVAYTATVSGIDSLTVGASFIMIPNKASTSKAPTLNVNGLGAKPIRRRLSSLTTSLQQGYRTNWIALNKPFTVVYDGTAWVIEGLTKTDGADVYGAVAQATADAKGNNIADTYATIAMLQSLLPKVTTITLTSNWVGDASPYYQDIALSCVTETSIVDLQPTPEQLNSWQDDGIAFTTLSGNGTVRVYVAGGKPSSAISVQVRVQEVTVI